MRKGIIIKKASGEEEVFSEEKLRTSLRKAGVLDSIADQVIEHISREAKEGMRSSDIHRHVMNLLKREAKGFAARYNLKRAIMDLGPTGHPFEKFVGEILKADGYSTQTNKMVQGKCVTHEVDVIAEKDERRIMVECKFHNQPGAKSDVKVALYVRSRFEDIEAVHRLEKNYIPQFHQAWLVTNTKLTSDAIRFSNCSGMNAIGWNYPDKGSLQNLIEEFGLHPITCLTTPTQEEKRRLVEHGIVLSKQLEGSETITAALGISESRAARMREEARELLNPQKGASGSIKK